MVLKKLNDFKKSREYLSRKRLSICHLVHFNQIGVFGLTEQTNKFTKFFNEADVDLAIDYYRKTIDMTKGCNVSHIRDRKRSSKLSRDWVSGKTIWVRTEEGFYGESRIR